MKGFYIIKQCIGIIILVIFAFVADYYVENIYLTIKYAGLQQLIMFVAMSIVLLVCNQLVLNYAKEHSDKFMKHKIWNKMFIVIFILMAVSFSGFITLFFTTPLESLISSHQWIMFIIIYYFLFLINLFVLSLIHKVVSRSMSNEKKILVTWASSTLLIALILFVLQNF